MDKTEEQAPPSRIRLRSRSWLILAAILTLTLKVLHGTGTWPFKPDPAARFAIRTTATPPASRLLAAAVYDSRRDRMIVLGGRDPKTQESLSELITYDFGAEHWEILPAAQGEQPQAIFGPAAAYDPKDDCVYLFGGWPKGKDSPSNELWKLDCAAALAPKWQRVADGREKPAGRNGASMVLDARRRRLILFGGDAGTDPKFGYTPKGDLWAFDLEAHTWKRLQTTGEAPKARWNQSMVADGRKDVLYLFGGVGYDQNGIVRDNVVYSLDLGRLAWRTVDAVGAPPPRMEGTSLTLDDKAEMLLVVGGLSVEDAGEPGPRSVWALDLRRGNWYPALGILSGTRTGHVAVYSPRCGSHVVFGGITAIERGNFYAKGEALSEAFRVDIRPP